MELDEFGERVKHWRTARGLRQADLARRAGVDRGTIIQIENGGGNPGYDTIRALAVALRVSILELMGRPIEIHGAALSPRAVALAERFDTLNDDLDQRFVWDLVHRFPSAPRPESRPTEEPDTTPESDRQHSVGDTSQPEPTESGDTRAKRKGDG